MSLLSISLCVATLLLQAGQHSVQGCDYSVLLRPVCHTLNTMLSWSCLVFVLSVSHLSVWFWNSRLLLCQVPFPSVFPLVCLSVLPCLFPSVPDYLRCLYMVCISLFSVLVRLAHCSCLSSVPTLVLVFNQSSQVFLTFLDAFSLSFFAFWEWILVGSL